MTPFDIRPMQRRLHVTADGILGPVTLTAFFVWMGAERKRAAELARAASGAYAAYGITAARGRFTNFHAQLGHESNGLRYMEEIASGAAYEGRSDLGNIQPGDGKRYKGRGPIQITGRANYRKYGRLIGVDIEANPARAAEPFIGLQLALAYWQDKRLNTLADAHAFEAITRKINGGTNGLVDRKKWLKRLENLTAP